MKSRLFIIFTFIIMPACEIFAQPPRQSSRNLTALKRELSPVRKKPDKEQKKILQPSQADLNKYAQFLNQPKTGIFRLFPDPGCEDNPNIVRADKKCLDAIPESSFYSFRENEHTAQYLSDLRLKNDYLISDGILAQGFLVKLGDTALESVSLSAEGLDFMSGFTVQTNADEAQAQYYQMARGVKSGNFFYGKAIPVVENATYALRVIAYRGSIYQRIGGYRYDMLDGDKRIDMTVAFRVIGKNADGIITILWKELDRQDAPKFQRGKGKRSVKLNNKNER